MASINEVLPEQVERRLHGHSLDRRTFLRLTGGALLVPAMTTLLAACGGDDDDDDGGEETATEAGGGAVTEEETETEAATETEAEGTATEAEGTGTEAEGTETEATGTGTAAEGTGTTAEGTGTEAGSTGTEGASGETNTVQVSLTEFKIDMPTSIPAGPTTFEISNDGSATHNFEIEGQGIEEELESNLGPGESGTLEVDLEPGTYEVYCPVDGHADKGMELELTVEG